MSDPWIVVTKWDEFQHYKDRTVPWIKFYAELLHDEEWLALPPRTRSLLCGVWLLYMSSRCALRALPRRLAGALNQQVLGSDLERLVQAGFITLESRPRLEHVQMASRPTRAREEEKREEEENPPTPLGKGGDAPLDKNGRPRKLTKRELARYTGCKITRGTHGMGHKHTPLGQDPPPKDWPHPPPTQTEVEAALTAAAEFVAHMEETT